MAVPREFAIYKQTWIDNLKTRERKVLEKPISTLFMTMVPPRGSHEEWATLVSYFTEKGEMVIVFADTVLTSVLYIENHLEEIFTKVRSISSDFEKIPIVIACQSIPKLFTARIDEAVSQLGQYSDSHIIMMHEAAGGSDRSRSMEAGVPNNFETMSEMALLTSELMEGGNVYFSERFTVLYGIPDTMISKILTTLQFVKNKTSLREDGSLKHTINGRGPGCPDDRLAIALMMAPHWRNVWNAQYRFDEHGFIIK